MKRLLFMAGALWVLLLSPGLCLAGAADRDCADCPGNISAGHSEDCSSDPCREMVREPDTTGCASHPDRAPALASGSLLPGRTQPEPQPRPGERAAPFRTTLPRPPSDLPLLI